MADYLSRMKRLRERVADRKLGGVVVVPGPNMKYLTGVDSLLLERPFMLLVPVDGDAHLVAPELEAGPYKKGKGGMVVHGWTDSQGPGGAIESAVKEAGVKGAWGAEGKVPFLFFEKLRMAAAVELKDAEPVLQELREVKSEEEARLLKKAAVILAKSFEEFPELMKAGMTEREVGRAVTEKIYEKGATKVDDVLVQSGPRASDPHGLPSDKKLQSGEGVIVDIGATYQGYYADITRTYLLGSNRELEDVYGKVLAAEVKAIRKAARGVQVGKVDAAARESLRKAGLAERFVHRTGHGLGLEVHEAPYIVEGGKEKLDDGMCFTVEPGVYLTDKLGVRIEDDVMIEGGKGVVLTGVPKEFGWWR